MATTETPMTNVGHPRRWPHPVSHRGEPAWELASLFPTQGDWTEGDYLALARRGKFMIELSDGCLEVLPMPTILHQRILIYIFELLRSFVVTQALGEVLFVPLPVRLWPGTYREPDIVFLKPGRVTDPHSQPEGADLVVEVVREGTENRARDLEQKPEDYARAGIAEYWIVDPEQQSIIVLTLEGSAYRTHGKFVRGQTATSVLLAGFSVAVDATFAAGEGK